MTILRLLECVEFHSKIINELNNDENECQKKLSSELRCNVENLKKIYNICCSSIVNEKINNNLSQDDLKSYNAFSYTLENLFEQLLN